MSTPGLAGTSAHSDLPLHPHILTDSLGTESGVGQTHRMGLCAVPALSRTSALTDPQPIHTKAACWLAGLFPLSEAFDQELCVLVVIVLKMPSKNFPRCTQASLWHCSAAIQSEMK